MKSRFYLLFVSIFCFIVLITSSLIVVAKPVSVKPLSSSQNSFYKEGYMNIEGGKIWYSISSSKEAENKTPLLIVHGGPGATHDYLNNLRALKGERPVILYDQLGSGKSIVSKSDKGLWQTSRFIDELRQLINFLELKEVILLGHSWGGALVAEYALKYPLKVKKLILASPLLSTKIWESDAQILIHKLPKETKNALLKQKKNEKEYQKGVDVYYSKFFCRAKPWPNNLKYSMTHINAEIYEMMWGANEFTATGNLKDFDVFSRLSGMTIPVLLTGGQYDEATPDTLAKAKKLIPNSKFVIFKKSSHVSHLEEEAAYLKMLSEFLNSSQ